MNRKYGFWTATAMIVGIVIGSGVFFKADDVLLASNGSIAIALLAWIVGAISMVFGAIVFSDCASRYEKSNGIVDYAEVMVSEKYGYLIGWFNSVIYYPALAAVLAWVSANYTCLLFGFNGNAVWYIALLYVVLLFIMNYFAPILAGRFQISATVIKLIPLCLIAVVGIITGLTNGILIENFVSIASNVSAKGNGFAAAVLSTAFAYEGWIVATTINSEIKDSKKNLSRALVVGAIIVFVIYLSLIHI
jgi:APA family basic amino acid/polyamine antiporter